MRHGHPRDIPDDLNRTLPLARRLRREMTIPERKLWKRLRANQTGLKLRRQHPIGPYVADFFCAPASTVIELDGEDHRNHREHDAARDDWMRSRGLMILRYSVSAFEQHPDGVVAAVVRTCRDRIAQAVAAAGTPPPGPRKASDHLPPSSTGGGWPPSPRTL